MSNPNSGSRPRQVQRPAESSNARASNKAKVSNVNTNNQNFSSDGYANSPRLQASKGAGFGNMHMDRVKDRLTNNMEELRKLSLNAPADAPPPLATLPVIHRRNSLPKVDAPDTVIRTNALRARRNSTTDMLLSGFSNRAQESQNSQNSGVDMNVWKIARLHDGLDHTNLTPSGSLHEMQGAKVDREDERPIQPAQPNKAAVYRGGKYRRNSLRRMSTL